LAFANLKHPAPSKNSIVSYDPNLDLKEAAEAFRFQIDVFTRPFLWRKDHIFYSAEEFFGYDQPITPLPDLCNILVLFLSTEEEVARVLSNPNIKFDEFTDEKTFFIIFVPEHLNPPKKKGFRTYEVRRLKRKKLKGDALFNQPGFADLHPELQKELIEALKPSRDATRRLLLSGSVPETVLKRTKVKKARPAGSFWERLKARLALWF